MKDEGGRMNGQVASSKFKVRRQALNFELATWNFEPILHPSAFIFQFILQPSGGGRV
jgi:hypothetical protein